MLLCTVALVKIGHSGLQDKLQSKLPRKLLERKTRPTYLRNVRQWLSRLAKFLELRYGWSVLTHVSTKDRVSSMRLGKGVTLEIANRMYGSREDVLKIEN